MDTAGTASQPSDVGRIRVLHVDDDPSFLDVTAEFLERERAFDVTTVTSASEGLDSLASDTFDCVVSDYEMPGLDGIEFLESVREEQPDLPFILFTGKGSEEVASEALRRGATDYLRKRSGTEQYALLANRVRNAVEQYRSAKRAAELDRIRTLASDVKRTAIRASSRDDLERDVCETLSEAEPYRFAWVGEVDSDTDRIVPRTSVGEEAGYLDEITVTADESPTGRGPAGTAVREQRVAVSQDVRQECTFDPWREAALARGYRAVAAVPLEYEQRLYGVLVVYADREGAFDDEEQDLLAELGADIAHALRSLEVRGQLREERDRRAALFEAAPVPVVAGAVEGDRRPITAVNEAFEEVFGLDAEEVVGEEIADAIVPESRREEHREIRERSRTGESVVTEVERITAEGTREFLLQVVPSGGQRGPEDAWYAWYTDITDRKRRERELERYETIVETVGDGVYALDETGKYTYVNEYFEERTGLDREEIIGDSPGRFIDEGDVAAFQEAIAEMVAGERDSFRMEVTVTPVEGEPYPAEAKVEPLVIDGRFEGTVGVVRDITERKRRERELERRAEELSEFRTLVDTVPDGVFKLDDEDRIVYVNEGWASMVGMDREAIEGREFTELIEEGVIPERVATEYGTLVRDLLSSDTDRQRGRFEIEATPPTDDRDHVYEAHVGLLPPDDGFRGTAVVARDVTERERRKRQLETLRERTEFALDATGSLIWTVDLATEELLDYTGPLESLFGVTPRDADTPAAFLEAAVHPEDRDEVARAWRTVVDGDSEHSTVEFRTNPDCGETRWVEVSMSRQTEDGTPRLVGLTTDVTERKRRERELERQNERLEDFAGIVSHDLRNPLNVASGRLTMAREECDSGYLDDVARAHDRMRELIDDLLALTREGEAATDLEHVDLTTVAERSWSNVETMDAALETGRERTLRADPARLQELLENLVRNAVEHGGSDVTVTVAPLDDGDGFYVADDGTGIPDGERERVFESGFTTSEHGTGLGLAIVRDVADAHGWEVDVTRSAEGGARFEVTGVETTE